MDDRDNGILEISEVAWGEPAMRTMFDLMRQDEMEKDLDEQGCDCEGLDSCQLCSSVFATDVHTHSSSEDACSPSRKPLWNPWNRFSNRRPSTIDGKVMMLQVSLVSHGC